VIEGGLHGLQRRLHPAQGAGVAVTQGVQGPLQWDPGQLGCLAQLLADILAVHRLVPPAAGEDGLLGGGSARCRSLPPLPV
jgi:hypothetical protein